MYGLVTGEIVPCGKHSDSAVGSPPKGDDTRAVIMSQTHPLPAQVEPQHNHATANAPINRPQFRAAVWIGQSGKRPPKPKSS
jgi:hypothetical protein